MTKISNSPAAKGTLTKRFLPATVAALAATFASSAAWAACGTANQLGPIQLSNPQVSIGPTVASAAIAGIIGNVNTAFLSQQGSAFVSAPPNPLPDQPGGGVWGRAIGGQVNLRSTSTSVSTNTQLVPTGAGPAGTVIDTTTQACANNTHEDFAGAQVGADIARLNWNGWNVHLGTTAGYLGSKESDDLGSSNTIQVPFIGTYLVATKGRFFSDLMVREEAYNINLNNPLVGLNGQNTGAHGFSISASAGYNFDLGQGWFAEPSAGFIYSKTSVDSFVIGGIPTVPIAGTVTTNDIEGEMGRLSLRVGRTIETPRVIWQPFASASVYHEFAGNVISNYTSTTNGAFLVGGRFFGNGVPQAFAQTTSTTRVGTYGQYSLGVAAQVVNTGWLGFVRVDYREGDNINGWTGNAGIRYQFTPEMIASVMPVKVKAPPHPFIAPTDWTGFYVGGVAGAAAGRTDVDFVGAPFPVAGAKPYTAGGLGGIELGYNRQFSNQWVVGVEGDIVATNLNGARTSGFANGLNQNGASVDFSPAFFTSQDRTNWMATIDGRLGYAWGRTLFYGKAGVALEDSSLTVACIYGPTGSAATRSCINQAGIVTGGFNTPSQTRVGWTAGFGTEFDLGHNWSAKTEYDFLSFGRHTALATDGTTVMTDKAYVSQVKVGVNYKFGPGPVVAKY